MNWEWKTVLDGVKPDAVRLIGAAAGAVCAWWAGLPAIAQALLIVQGADVLTGVLLALMGKSSKSESGKVSSGALGTGLVKKGLEWLVVGICVAVGHALEMKGIAAASMTYVMAAELVSLMENLSVFGLKIPMLEKILDVAQNRENQA